jgi:hypothetical protein
MPNLAIVRRKGREAEWSIKLRLSTLVLPVLIALPLFACSPQGNNPSATEKEGKISLKVCKDDREKLCPNMVGKERGKCLRQNIDKVSAPCKAALEARRAARKKRKEDEGD